MYDNAQSSTVQKGLREPTGTRVDKYIRVHAHTVIARRTNHLQPFAQHR